MVQCVQMNNDPRADPGVRRLIHLLETGEDVEQPAFEKDTNKFTALLNKHAAMIDIYLFRKTKIFYKAFLGDVCGVEQFENSLDWSCEQRCARTWAWTRIEFTETRGECLRKLLNNVVLM